MLFRYIGRHAPGGPANLVGERVSFFSWKRFRLVKDIHCESVGQLINLEISKALWGWHRSCRLSPAACFLSRTSHAPPARPPCIRHTDHRCHRTFRQTLPMT